VKDQAYDIEHMKSPYLQLSILILGVFMAILDTSVVNIAVPTMESAFGATTNQIQWVLTGYMLTIGVLVPISGWLTDRFGAKKLFLFALATFTIGSALCGAAWSTSSIILFRIIQALGGGFMMPVAQAIIFRTFPPQKRGFVMGLFGISIMAAPAFGPALSGYLVEYSTWRLIFYINVPFGILAFFMGAAFLQELQHQVSGKLDILGFMFSTGGFFSLLYGLNEIPSDGWKSPVVLGFVGVGVILLILLVITELVVENPIIQLRVFKDYMFSLSVVIGSIINIALFAGIFLIPLYLQDIVGLSPVRTGLLMTPAAIATAIMMPISGRLMDRIGARPLGLVGLFIITVATVGFTTLGRNTSVGYIQLLYIMRSVGMGLTMMPIMTAGMNTLPRQLVSQGSAVSNTARQVAASLGTAVLTTVLTSREKFHFAVMAQNVTPWSVQAQSMLQMQQMLQGQGMSPSIAHALAFGLYKGVLQATAFVQGLNDTFVVATAITITAFVLTIFFGSKKERDIRRGHRKVNDASKGKGSPAMAPMMD